MKAYIIGIALVVGSLAGYVMGSNESAMDFCVSNLVDVRAAKGRPTNEVGLKLLKEICEKRLQSESH